mmetsp:Transcript_3934/g.8772  ORF Transcript_3934/g.8772 Transcript_3934/m.8772 type:complete len:894 (-) Transcript_3934:447-3128(-)
MFATLAKLALAATDPIELHGSGTTNPSKLYWQAMDLMMARAKIPLHMTYRAVGSSTGQAEFVGASNTPAGTPYTHFGSGDIPMTTANFDALGAAKMLHIPFAVSAIAIFHSVPAADNAGQPLNLDACTLAKIFRGKIASWEDAAIKALNPSLKISGAPAIKLAHRTYGSSSTAGTTEYLKTACPTEWEIDAGSTVDWPATGNAVEGSGGMTTFIRDNAYAIGYLDAGHGTSEGLSEVALTNAAGKKVTSTDADIGEAANQKVSSMPADATSADWSNVNLYNMPGDTTWPIAVMSYLYVRQELSAMNPGTASLLRAFLNMILSEEGQELATGFGFAGLPSTVLEKSKAAVGQLTMPAGVTEFTFETGTQAGTGAGEYVISGKRRSFAEYERSVFDGRIQDLQAKVTMLEEQLEKSSVFELHGSGTTNPSKFFWQTMDLFEDRSRHPIYMTYRGVGSSTGQAEFVGETNVPANTAFNHFGSGDIPMSAANFAKLGDRKMVHIPFAVGAIAIFHSVPAAQRDNKAIDLEPCLLAKIFAGTITEWDHPDIKAANTHLAVPAGTKIKVAHRKEGSSSTSGTTEYLDTACKAEWSDKGKTTGSTVEWAAGMNEVQGSGGMASFIAANEYAIGYLDAGHGQSEGFAEVALRNKDDVFITSAEANIGAAATSALGAEPSPIPAADADWSAVNLYDMTGPKTWPITMFSYFYVEKDMSRMHRRTAALLHAFITYTLSAEGQTALTEFAFSKLPSEMLTYNTATIATITWPANMEMYEFEIDTQRGHGSREHVLSVKRRSFTEYQQDALHTQIAALQAGECPPARVEYVDVACPTAAATGSGGGDGDGDSASTIAVIGLIVAVLALLGAGFAVFKATKKPYAPQRDSPTPAIEGNVPGNPIST